MPAEFESPENGLEQADAAHVVAYRKIKKAILSREIGISEPLVELRLSRDLGLSRTPVREALRLLESEGLVRHRAGKGWAISFLDQEDLREIFDLKLILEPAAASRAALVAPPDIRAQLVAITEQMTRSSDEDDAEAWLAHDQEFHHILMVAAGNKYLAQAVDNLNQRWWRVQTGVAGMTGRMTLSSVEHATIANAIAQSNPDEAARVMVEHLVRVRESVEKALQAVFAISNVAV